MVSFSSSPFFQPSCSVMNFGSVIARLLLFASPNIFRMFSFSLNLRAMVLNV